jgi:polyisoprenoid-binding protein YceI
MANEAPFLIRPTGESSFALDLYKKGILRRRKYVLFFERYTGEMNYLPESPGETTLRLSIEAAGLACRDESLKPKERRELTELVKGEILGADRFEWIEFRSQRAEAIRSNGIRLEGTLTLRGIEKPAALNITVVRLGNNRLELDATATLSLNDFGAKPASGGFTDQVELRVLLWPERGQATNHPGVRAAASSDARTGTRA